MSSSKNPAAPQLAKKALLLAAVALAGLAAAQAQQQQQQAPLLGDVRQVVGFSYLYSTDLGKRQQSDVIRSFDASLLFENGGTPKGMHKCARMCRKEGGGGVCVAWSFCWSDKRCTLLSRLPASLLPAAPSGGVVGSVAGTLSSAVGLTAAANAYDAKCASGVWSAAIESSRLAAECKATVHKDTTLGDTLSLTAPFRNRLLRADYEANQPSPADCCALCGELKSKGCTSWTYDKDGWFMDASRKCTLRTGASPQMTAARGVVSGVMTK